MKKKILLILICGVLLLNLTGCGKEEDSSSNNITYGDEINCSALDNVKFATGHGFITNDNDVYYMVDGKLSNKESCIKVSETPIKTYYNDNFGSLFIDYENNYYKYNEQEALNKSENESMPSIIKDTDNVVKYFNKSFYLTKDGIIYDVNNNVIKSFDNERILDFSVMEYDYNEYIISYIKTDKAYYFITATNIKECNEYVDIKCNYELTKNDYFTENYNNIAYIKSMYAGHGNIVETSSGIYQPLNDEATSLNVEFVTKDKKIAKIDIKL